MKPNTAARWALLVAAAVVQGASLLSFGNGDSPYRLAGQGVAPVIKVSGDDWPAVRRTARDLAADFGRVVGTNGTVSVAANGTTAVVRPCGDRPVIVAGTIGSSGLVDALVAAGKLDVSRTKGRWEAYTSQVVRDVAPGVPWALVVAGSDRRGTIYGLYDISETMGVSPWYWWADVPVKTKTHVYVKPEGKVQKEPSVQYRGFFINDEHPALLGWINEKFRGVWGSDFYAHVFELCLRLKGNYLWPAMWGKMFYNDDPKNGPLAEEFGVVMGTSHHEPMARSEREQQLYNNGHWDWVTNKENITKFFKQGISRSLNWETYYTMGMRGSGDAASPTLTAPALEEIIGVQQKLLSEAFNTTNLISIPQTWVLYKEVSEYYKTGLKVPDSVMLLWTDDNSGNLIRVPTASEADRAAGAGVYYHFDYVGSPRSYKWINTIQLVKTWEQMHLAYEKKARHLWLANVGDLKPLEIPLTHFMDMAYDMDRHTTPDSTTAWLKRWAGTEFGAGVADATAAILNEYGILTGGRRKYELLSDEPFSTTNYDEAERNLAQWEALLKLTQATYDSLDAATKISYFQLIMHPVMAGKTVVDLYTKTWLNRVAAGQGRVSANALAAQATALFARDAEITKMYNTLNGGKWNHFVDQVHIGYTSWNDPPENIMPRLSYTGPTDAPGTLGVAFQGSTTALRDGASARIFPVDQHLPPADKRWLEVFARKNGTFAYTISSNASFVTVTNAEGTITAPGDGRDVRSTVSVDWDRAPEGQTSVALTVRGGGGELVGTAILPVIKAAPAPAGFSGFVESNGVVAVEAAHFSSAESKGGLSYVEIPHYGRTLSGVKTMPATSGPQTAVTGPALKYSLYATAGNATAARLVVYLGPSHNHDPTRPLRFAYSFDGAAPVEVKPVPDVPIYREGPEWRAAVVNNGWTSTVSIPGGLGKGAHELSLWLLEPGVVLQKIAVDFGGLRPSSFGPHESKKV